MNAYKVTRHRQSGATLVVGLIMLVMLTLIVTSAFTMSTTSLKAVGNMQFRDEAIAAANKAIEQVIESDFTTSPAAETIEVDINNDSNVDYEVAIAVPECVRATVSTTAPPSSLSLPATMSTGSTWNTIWDIYATAASEATNASVRVHSGTRVLLSQAQKDLVCP